MNTTENNKLIAEFMGFKINTTTSIDVLYNEKTCEVLDLNKLKYHFDWNWLIEVVEKIESLGYTFLTLKSPAYLTYIEKDIFKETKHKGISNTKIESVYNACVEFIKWYNKQQK